MSVLLRPRIEEGLRYSDDQIDSIYDTQQSRNGTIKTKLKRATRNMLHSLEVGDWITKVHLFNKLPWVAEVVAIQRSARALWTHTITVRCVYFVTSTMDAPAQQAEYHRQFDDDDLKTIERSEWRWIVEATPQQQERIRSWARAKAGQSEE